MHEDISVRFDTRPNPIVDRKDFDSWATTYTFCTVGKDNGSRIYEVHERKDHFRWGMVSDVITWRMRVQLQQGPIQQYPTQSSKSPQSSTEPYPSDNFQMNSGSSSTENLIESLSNSLALLTQWYKSHLPQTNNQLRASSNARTKLMVPDWKVVVSRCPWIDTCDNHGRPFHAKQ
ncbi:hypothetical protein Tco_1142466 [Tanacetum coccineum]